MKATTKVKYEVEPYKKHYDSFGSSPVDKAQYTSGQWRTIINGRTIYPEVWADINERHSVKVADCNNDSLGNAEILANAALIASAPDLKAENIRLKAINEELLEALVGLMTATRNVYDGPMIAKATKAIAKARNNHE